ncbi:type VI secretion system-associated FHA domain protein TagH [Roseibium sp. MMSF_3544]|uniref:type VI secretion system-associated FHA domain protein TagH n=1 Tax=unclassified Roseibium TaxID=2629323 RepID=UPI00273FD8F8|nr:type VI secretion system-associated FHA domain protein TagH [Roseibium sp. MMSF_3544]
MRITLQIENVDRLQTGGQVSYSCSDRGFDIGRHEHLDWSLPDPQRVVSGKHCEVRYESGQFVLVDVSTNGTFLNGSPNRMDKAHVLRSGDRVMIGDYIIAVTLDGEASAGAGFGGAATAAPEPAFQAQTPHWQSPEPAAPAAHESQWPSASPSAPPPYPVQEGGGPWGPPTTGMEGRHAPPSQAPGIGTPADDVWSQQGHGWGSADPGLYDPQSRPPDAQPVRPAQADPMDHLAAQPELHSPEPTPQPPAPAASVSPQAPAFPAAPDAPASQEPSEPLFKMPDLAAAEEPVAPADEDKAPPPPPPPPPVPEPAPEIVARESVPADPIDSPFPEAPAKSEPAAEETPAQLSETAPESNVQTEPDVAPEAAPASPAAQPTQAENAVSPEQQSGAPVSSPDLLKAFAEGAGIPEAVLADRDPEEFAKELGEILQGVTGDLMGLLQARSQVKAMTRNANRTLISRSGNNALKFSPTPQMALQTMLAHNVEETGYLPMSKAMSESFKDIQKHHVWTYAAMQKAAARFDSTLSPGAIEEEGQVAKSTFGSQKAKLWERMQERWNSLSSAYDDGLVGVFTQYFTESYEELSSQEPEQ